MSDGERFLLKNLLNEDSIGVVAAAVAEAYAGFDRAGFRAAVFDEEWEGRELKQRMRHVAEVAPPGDGVACGPDDARAASPER